MDFTKPETVLELANIRESLIRMEDTIVFNLIERAQFYKSESVYDQSKLSIAGFDGSFLDWFLLQNEKTQSKIRRYEAPDEVPFYPDQLEKPILPSLSYPKVLASYHKEINVNDEIKEYYIKSIVPKVAASEGEQSENVGSCAVCDMECLQSISRRIHFGKFVAECKFQNEKEKYTALIKARDAEGIDKAITNMAVEEKVLERIGSKTDTYTGPVLRWSQKVQGNLTKEIVTEIYKNCIIPLTKKVEVDYLLRRLEED
ncbi:chorismate mutase [Trichomonascus vanleenenianus]|uniref:chorismate mutase ARO7 n=1 Tax=Trichomonascus vanleenenianus TaxID=2268995 RepID=UPI003EC99A64